MVKLCCCPKSPVSTVISPCAAGAPRMLPPNLRRCVTAGFTSRPWMAFANQPLPTLAEQVVRVGQWEARRRSRAGTGCTGCSSTASWSAAVACTGAWGSDGLEIGYWVHVAHTRRRIASRTVALLIATAFSLEQINCVEIHHDAANLASEGVPRGLGFVLVGESPDTRRPRRARRASSGVGG